MGREFGMGRERGGDEKGKVSLRATWGQGGQGRIIPKEGFQVSKGEMEGKVKRESARGVKQGHCAISCIVNLYMCIRILKTCRN